MASLLVDFEEGDLSDFNTEPTGTAYSVTSPSILGTYKCEVDYGGTFTGNGSLFTTGEASLSVWRIGAWLNLNTVSYGSANSEPILQLFHNDDEVSLITWSWVENAGNIDISIETRHDTGTDTVQIAVAQSGWFHVEVVETVATGVSANDGIVEILINGVQASIDNAVDNYNRLTDSGSDEIAINFGDHYDSTGASGIWYIDHIQWNDVDAPTFDPGIAGVYGISLAIDRETDGGKLWVSTWESGTLYARQFDASTLADLGKTSLGSAAIADVQARTNTAYVAAGSDLHGWAYGNMVNPAGITGTYQLIETATGVTGSWSALALGWLDNDVLRAFHTTPDLSGGGSRLYSGVRWFASGSVNQLQQGSNGLAYIIDIPLVTGSVKHGAFDVSSFYHIALGGDTLGTGANRVLGTVPPYSSWSDITNNYPSGTVDVLRFL